MMKKKIIDWWFELNDKINRQMNAYLSGKPIKINKESFFESYRISLGKLSQKQVNALNEFIDLTNENISDLEINQWAYLYATTYHETNKTFEPVIEAYWLDDAWRKKNLRYYPFFGRGFVQLTWDYNYKKYSELLGVDMISNPDLALEVENSFYILVHGSKYGTFTGKKLNDYISKLKSDYVGARRIINGTDKANQIAEYAKKFEQILKESTK